MQQLPDGACVTDAKFLPIIAAYVNKLSIVETVNRMCPTEACDVSTGHMAAAMILDTLSGRSPLYLLERAFEHLDIELLPGIPISAEKLNDDAAARALDRISRALRHRQDFRGRRPHRSQTLQCQHSPREPGHYEPYHVRTLRSVLRAHR